MAPIGANISVAGVELPTFGSRRVETRLRLRDGESNLLAGLLREEDRSTLRGFPGLLRVPLLRSLFGNTKDEIRQTDIVILLTPRIVRGHELMQRDLNPIRIGTQTHFGLTGPPPLIAPQPDAGVPDTPEPTPPVDPAPGAATPEPAVPPPSLQAETPPARPDVQAAAQVLVTPPGAQLRVGGGPFAVPISIAGASQLSTISRTLFYDPNVLRVRRVQVGSFLRQGGVEVTFTQQVDTAAGRIDITAARVNDPTGAAGVGLIAAVVFDAVGVGSVTLSMSGTAMTPGGAPLALQFPPVTVTAP